MPGDFRRSGEVSEMDASSNEVSSLKELASNGCERYEMEGTKDCAPRPFDDPPQYSIQLDAASEYRELIPCRSQKTLQRKPVPPPSNVSQNLVGPRFGAARSTIIDESMDQNFGFPLSDIQDLPRYSLGPDVDVQELAGSSSQPNDPFSSMHLLSHVHDDYLSPSPAYEYHDSVLSIELPSTRSQVAVLRDVVDVLNVEWIEKLQRIPNLKVPCVPSLFKKGLQALQDCYRGRAHYTLDEAFALLHVAFAIAYILYGNDTSFPWADYFHNMLQWRHTIRDHRDARLLETAIMMLWSPEESATGNFGVRPSAGSTITGSPTQSRTDIRTLLTSEVQHYSSSWWQPHITEPPPADLIGTLKKGMVLHECSSFFNGKWIAKWHTLGDLTNSIAFEHGDIAERATNVSQLSWYRQQHEAYGHVSHTDEMIDRIIRPLQTYMGTEALRACILDTERQLYKGSLRCAREVEVFLLSSGRVSRDVAVPSQGPF